jgi:hypothetical protein
LYISLPDENSTGVTVIGGGSAILFAADTAAVSKRGHRSQFPGITESITIQIPTLDGRIPDHTVLYLGPCNASQTTGLRDLATGTSLQAEPSIHIALDNMMEVMQANTTDNGEGNQSEERTVSDG